VKNASVLLVSPEKTMRSLVTHALGRDFALEMAEDMVAGMDALSEGHQVVLVEYDMSGVNGLEFLQEVRCGRTKARRDVAIGLLTGFADQSHFAAALSLDLNAMLLKPLSRNDIERRVVKMAKEGVRLKPAAQYETVEIPLAKTQLDEAGSGKRSPVAVRMPELRRPPAAAPAAKPIEQPVAELRFGPLRRRPVLEVQVGWQIGMDVIGPNGVCLVAANAVLTPRILARLREIAATGAVTEVWARAPMRGA
jgi:CheY-like chemotaxis protein